MSRQLSKLQQDILQAAAANGGMLTYKEAYTRFISFNRPKAFRPNAIFGDKANLPPNARHFALQGKFDRQAERLRHTMHRLVRRGLAVFFFSEARLFRAAAYRLEYESRCQSKSTRGVKPSGISVTLPGNRTLAISGPQHVTAQ